MLVQWSTNKATPSAMKIILYYLSASEIQPDKRVAFGGCSFKRELLQRKSNFYAYKCIDYLII